MIEQDDNTWRERFRQALPNRPVPPRTLQKVREVVRLEVARLYPNTGSALLDALLRLFGGLSPRGAVSLGGAAFAALALAFTVAVIVSQPPSTLTASVNTSGQIRIARADGRIEDISGPTQIGVGDWITATRGEAVVTYDARHQSTLVNGAELRVRQLGRAGTRVDIPTGVTRHTAEDGVSMEVRSPSARAQLGARQAGQHLLLASTELFQINPAARRMFVVESNSTTETYFAAEVGGLGVEMDAQQIALTEGQEVEAVVGQPLVARPIGSRNAPPPTATATPTAAATPTATATATATPTATATATPTPTATATVTLSPVSTVAPRPTQPLPPSSIGPTATPPASGSTPEPTVEP
jgi:hypothetical protein